MSSADSSSDESVTSVIIVAASTRRGPPPVNVRQTKTNPDGSEDESDTSTGSIPQRQARATSRWKRRIVESSEDESDTDAASIAPRRTITATTRWKRRIVESSAEESDAIPQPATPGPASLSAPVKPATRAPRRSLAMSQRQQGKELVREAIDLLCASHKMNADEARFKRLQNERKSQPWIEVEVEERLAPALPAPEFAAAQLWSQFVQGDSNQRWLAAHESFYEYRDLYLKMLPVLVQLANTPERVQALEVTCAALPALTDRRRGDNVNSVASAAWALPWRTFIETEGDASFASGLEALKTLNADIRGKHATFLEIVGKDASKADAKLLRAKVEFTLEDDGDALRLT